MAISASTPIDFAKIAAEMRTIVARWYNAQIKIIDPKPSPTSVGHGNKYLQHHK